MKKFMGLLAVFMVLWITGVYATPTTISNFTMSLPTSTTLYLTFTAPGDDADSCYICGADSLIIGTLSATATDTTITGLTPHTQYIWKIRSKQTGGITKYSNLDTLYTAYPNVESSKQVAPTRWMYGARSWIPDDISYDTLYVYTETGLDSTMIYWSKEYTAVQAKVIGNADSCKVNLYCYNGHAEETNPKNETSNNVTGTWNFNYVQTDNYAISDVGWSKVFPLSVSPADHFYLKVSGVPNNGALTKVILRLYRRGL